VLITEVMNVLLILIVAKNCWIRIALALENAGLNMDNTDSVFVSGLFLTLNTLDFYTKVM